MVTIAIRMERYELAESILEDYRHSIHPNWQENAYFLNLSDIRFLKYDLVLDTLNRVEFTDGRMAACKRHNFRPIILRRNQAAILSMQ